MRHGLTVLGAAAALLAASAGAYGLGFEQQESGFEFAPTYRATDAAGEAGVRGTRLETLWIYDADFENQTGHNAGWTSLDRSGTLGQDNYWHKDTIRIRNFTHLGDSTWWCGTYNPCWCQPRGYGNSWTQYLERDFELGTWSSTGQTVELEFDQRYAMEHDYDYGYIDVSTDGGDTWTTIQSYTNPGFAGKPGTPKDWDSDKGHQRLDLSAFAGQDVKLRFRFESDAYYSAQDEYDNPAHSVKDGAWQFDNVEWNVWKPDSTQVWYDDVEAPGDNAWVHEGTQPHGQIGVVFFRGLYGVDFVTGRPFTCGAREGWMYAAVDPWTSQMVNDQHTWLISPPIDISGAPKLVGEWDVWMDLPRESEDLFDIWLASNDLKSCVQDPAGFVDEEPGAWYGGPFWVTEPDDWDAFAGNDWFAINWRLWNSDEPTVPGSHMGGIFLNRQRVGVPSGDPGTAWNYGVWNRFNDWFQEQLADALLDTAIINIKDDDEIASASMLASNDGGTTWSVYPMLRPSPFGNDWYAPPPAAELTPGSEIWYYFEAIDGVGNTSVYPTADPGHYELSILPLEATVSDPGILLVDKFGRRTTGEGYDYAHYAEYYYTEALEILGYDWEVYDVEVPSGSTDQSDGPDTCGYKYYDTQLWFTNNFRAYTLKPFDQYNLIQWLSEAPEKERNLLLMGNDIGYELVETHRETLSFLETWLATEYLEDSAGEIPVDTCLTIKDVPGDHDFMTHDDRESKLRGGCPEISYFDVLQPYPGSSGTELPIEYERHDGSEKPAGCAFTHQTMGYQTVVLGFGLAFVSGDAALPGHGCFVQGTGIYDRVDLMSNIMEYFEVDAPGVGTNVPTEGFRNELSYAYPNPFNPVTAIAYSVREPGHVTVRVYSVAGKAVRTLLDEDLEAGASGQLFWDGLNDARARCASGVYFYRIEAPGFATTRKMVMLK